MSVAKFSHQVREVRCTETHIRFGTNEMRVGIRRDRELARVSLRGARYQLHQSDGLRGRLNIRNEARFRGDQCREQGTGPDCGEPRAYESATNSP